MQTLRQRIAYAGSLAMLGLLAACGSGSRSVETAATVSVSAPTPAAPSVPHIGHVFLLVLENEDYENSFGADSPATYLAKTLPARGALLSNYYGTAHYSQGNYIALISGQGPNADTQADCHDYVEFRPTAAVDVDGQAIGRGCVYPADVPSLPDQLEQAGLSWRGYMEDMGNNPHREAAACGRPQIGKADPARKAEVGDQYATKHNPFVYFHRIIDDAARCDRHVVSLKQLAADLASMDTTPSFAFITPGLCHDGHDSPCVDGEPGGLVSADAFLQQWVPQILDSAAFKQDGLLIVTFDESNGPQTDSSACCGELPGPNAHSPGVTGRGGGRIGAVLLSPFIKPGTVSATPYNHYSLLRSVEDIFGLPYLGYAAAKTQSGLGGDVYAQQAPALPAKN